MCIIRAYIITSYRFIYVVRPIKTLDTYYKVDTWEIIKLTCCTYIILI